jgi:Flp pilus assembly protein TadD
MNSRRPSNVGVPRLSEKESGGWIVAGCAAAIAAAATAAYARSFSDPFVFLDIPAIVDNPTLRHLWPLWPVLHPPSAGGITVGGRPIVNLSLALNFAISGTQPWSYHLANLLIHVCAGLALFGVVRRTLGLAAGSSADRPAIPGAPDSGGAAAAFAVAVALLWTLHPLQTESVTYVVQRAESLMGLFYLLTMYCFIRYSSEPVRRGAVWAGCCFLCCLLGMATKEVMASAPVIVLLYDRTFVSGSLRAAWARHRWVHGALFATWVPLAFLVAGAGGNRGGTSGFGLGLSWTQYALTQCPAMARYLRLAFWPSGQDFFYPVHWIHSASEVAPGILVVSAVLAASLFGLWRGKWWGLAGIWFFAILAPTSLVPGMTQTVAEHRMYLALAPIAVVAVAAIECVVRPVVSRFSARPGPSAVVPAAAICVILACVLGAATVRRNRVYSSEWELWSDTAAKSSDSPYVLNNLGVALASAGREAEAAGSFERAVALAPDYAEAHNNLALALGSTGRLSEAIEHYKEALRLRPNYAEAEANFGVALNASGHPAEAIEHLRRAVRLAPGYADAHNNFAAALAQSGRLPEAIAEYRTVIGLRPDRAEVHYNLGNALLASGRREEAANEYREAVRLKPDDVEARSNLGAVLAQLGRMAEAIEQYRLALDRAPGDPDIHYNLGLALRATGRAAEADSELAAAAGIRARQPPR